ncbi:hypothetical protein ACQR3P_29130 [Rhodococcus sp. IEGM1300]
MKLIQDQIKTAIDVLEILGSYRLDANPEEHENVNDVGLYDDEQMLLECLTDAYSAEDKLAIRSKV